MSISKLIAQLKEAENLLGPDAEVRLASQPSYPLAASVQGVAVLDGDDDQSEYAWIAEGPQPHDAPYAPAQVWDHL